MTSKPLVVTIDAEIGSQIEALAKEQHRTSEDVVFEACRRHLAAVHAAERDEEYALGYENTPEDDAELQSLMPHLPVPPEVW